jgi:zinc transport system ATP-binding protein
VIELRDVTLGYGSHVVVAGVSFRVERGEIAALLGPNGAGKTTLLRALLGELKPRSGHVVRDPKLRIGYVPQVDVEGSFWPMRVRDFVRLFSRDDVAVETALAGVGISELADRDLQDLSGGQRQKVLLAKALANEPNVLLLDEPTQGMDVASESDYLDLLEDLHRSGMTIVLVTHLLHVALSVARIMVLVDRGQTRVTSVREIIDGKVLDAIYGRPFSGASLGNSTVLVPDRRPRD